MPKSPPDPLAAHLAGYFDEIAADYEGWAGGLHGKVAASLCEWAAPAPGERCLDVGTGTGLVARRLAARVRPGGEVVGVDLSAGMLAQARLAAAGNPEVRFLRMAGERLDFRSSSFQLVTYGDSLAHLVDPYASLEEAGRVLSPDGRIALSCRRGSHDTPAQRLSLEWLERLAVADGVRVPRHHGSHDSFGEPEVLTGLLEEFGFGEVRLTQLITGFRAAGFVEWISLLEGLEPASHQLIMAMGPVRLRSLARALVKEMEGLGDGAWRIHHSYTLATAQKQG